MRASFQFLRRAGLALLALPWLVMPAAGAACPHGTVHVVLSSPLSSRIDHRNDPVTAVLLENVVRENLILPAGSRLSGRILKISPSSARHTGRLMVVFTQAVPGRGEAQPLTAMADTGDGWLEVTDAGQVWEAGAGHSTRLLNQKLLRRLGSDQAVWAQILGLHTNRIPDPTTDQFIRDYHARDVLLGAGDVLRLRLGCPGLFEIK